MGRVPHAARALIRALGLAGLASLATCGAPEVPPAPSVVEGGVAAAEDASVAVSPAGDVLRRRAVGVMGTELVVEVIGPDPVRLEAPRKLLVEPGGQFSGTRGRELMSC